MFERRNGEMIELLNHCIINVRHPRFFLEDTLVKTEVLQEKHQGSR